MVALDDICKAAGVGYTTNMLYLVNKIRDMRIRSDRYDKVRHLNARQFAELFRRNIEGRRFDEMVDEM